MTLSHHSNTSKTGYSLKDSATRTSQNLHTKIELDIRLTVKLPEFSVVPLFWKNQSGQCYFQTKQFKKYFMYQIMFKSTNIYFKYYKSQNCTLKFRVSFEIIVYFFVWTVYIVINWLACVKELLISKISRHHRYDIGQNLTKLGWVFIIVSKQQDYPR